MKLREEYIRRTVVITVFENLSCRLRVQNTIGQPT